MIPRHDSDGITAQREPQPKVMFCKQDGAGRKTYVHMMMLDQTTTDRNYAWSGTQRQALNVRAKFPHTRAIPLVRLQHR